MDMNWQKSTVNTLAAVSGSLGLALLCGCGTMLAQVGNIPDEHVAYIVKGALGQVDAQKEIGQRIAEQELMQRLNDAPIDEDSRNLRHWQQRVTLLEKPIAIETQRIDRASELRNISDRDVIASYINNNPEQLSLNGAAYSAAWSAMLEQAKEKVKKLSSKRLTDIADADKAVAAQDYLRAMAALSDALEITPADADLVSRSAQVVADGWATTKAAMELNVLKKGAQLIANRDASSQQMERFEKSVLDEQNAMMTFMETATAAGGLKALPVKDRFPEAAGILDAANGVVGAVWGKNTKLLTDHSDFLAVYNYLSLRIENAETLSVWKNSQLVDHAKSLYAQLLAPAMAYFIEAASAAYSRDQYGLSYICCMMVEEMYDYAVTKQLNIPLEATTQLEFVRSVERDNVEKIAAQHSRKLFILDFLPAVTEEGEQVAYQARTLCKKKYTQSNDLAWGLSVPQGKTLTQASTDPIASMDTVISGEIKEVTINTVPGREYDQGFVEVGSANIVEVVNPLYDIHDNEPETIWQQEVARFYRVKREHRKEGVLALMLYGEFQGQPSRTLLDLNVKFPSKELPLAGITMQCEEIAFANPISGTPRTAAKRDGLAADEYPQSIPPQLTSDKEITKAVLEFALNEIDRAIERLVVQYPVANLAEPAAEAQKKGEYSLSAEYWGQFILYCGELSKATLSTTQTGTTTWTELRTKMAENLSAWSVERWGDSNASTLREIAGFWTNATQAAMQAVVEKTSN